jgi:hypothetical protein
MRELSFQKLCEFLATTHGGYTVWFGAGVGIAMTRGAAPSWKSLISGLTVETDLPADWTARDYPSRLDWIASQKGHRAFRAALRRAVVEPMLAAEIEPQVVKDMAVIGLRAGALVSFNIEIVSAIPLSVGRGGSFVPRAYRRPEAESMLKPWTGGGVVGSAVFFPHGILDLEGNCVITKSEYDAHRMSLAVGTAVNLCLGGDLLIVGMSLDDAYLRDAILQHRRWIRDVFWVDSRFQHEEWARVANVHCVRASYGEIWSEIATAHIAHDSRGELAGLSAGSKGVIERAVRGVETARRTVREFESKYVGTAQKLLQPQYTPRDFARFARQCDDLGFEVPDFVSADPRYARTWTEGLDPQSAVFEVGSR